MTTDQAIEAAARAIGEELGIRNWGETAEDRGDLRMKVRQSYSTYDVNEPTKMDLRDAARAAAPILMEQGARLALEAVEQWLRKDRPFYDLNPLADEMVAQLDPAEIAKGSGRE